MSENNMNPDITTVKIGIRQLKEITIYPLSIGSQLSATEIIQQIMSKVTTFDDKMEDSLVIKEFLDILRKNITKILNFVVDKEIDLDELTNPQLEEIINIIYNCNYRDIVKNSKDLIGKTKSVLASMRS